jgi:hypothetical protein
MHRRHHCIFIAAIFAALLIPCTMSWAEDGMCLVVVSGSYTGDYTVGNIRRIDMRNNAVVNTTGNIGYGCFPRFSPDGQQFAFINGNTVTIANIDGGVVRSFNAGGNGNLTWGNTGIWVCANGQFYKYAVADGHQILTKSFSHCERGQVSRNEITGGGVWTQDWHPTIYSFGKGTTIDVPKPAPVNGVQYWVAGCSVCPNPSGTLLTNNLSSVGTPPNVVIRAHQYMRILDTLGNEKLRINLQTITGLGNDRFWNEQTWSGNSDDWIVLPIGRTNDVSNPSLTNSNEPWIYNLTTHEVHQLANRTGDFWHPYDYYSGFCPGSAAPAIQLSPSSLSFAADSGGANPPAQTVTASTANGTLQTLAVSGAKSWLTVTPGAASGASILIVNSPAVAGLRVGTYLDTITVTTANAGTKTYPVTLTVRTPSVVSTLASCAISPDRYTVAAGASIVFIPTCKDQTGKYFTSATLSWSASGGGSVNQSGRYTAAATPSHGPHLVIVAATARGVTLRDTAKVMVSTVSCIHKRIDSGNNAYLPAGWESDDAYATGGSDWDNAATITTAGVPAAAPAGVYQSMRRGNPHSYHIPGLPQDFYTVRLHFADPKDTVRLMQYTIQNVNVLRDFAVVPLAGAINKALALDFATQIQDTNGMLIACAGGSGSNVFEAGLEVMENVLKPITLVSPNGGEHFAVGQTLTVKFYTDTLQVNQLFVHLSVDDGKNYHLLTGAAGILMADNRAGWGAFTWTIPDSIARDTSCVSTRCRIRLSPYFASTGGVTRSAPLPSPRAAPPA